MMNKTLYFASRALAYREANKLEDFNMVICVINNSILVLFYIEFVFYFSTLM